MTNVTPGAWVLTESVLINRRTSPPWKVTKVSGGRVYMERPEGRTRHGDFITSAAQRYVQLKSVKYVFATQEAAMAVFESDDDLGREYDAKIKEIWKANNEAFTAELARHGGQRAIK